MDKIHQISKEIRSLENQLDNESFPALPDASPCVDKSAEPVEDMEQSTSSSSFSATLNMWRSQEPAKEADSVEEAPKSALSRSKKRRVRKKILEKRIKDGAISMESLVDVNQAGGSTPATGSVKQDIRKKLPISQSTKRKNSDPNPSLTKRPLHRIRKA